MLSYSRERVIDIDASNGSSSDIDDVSSDEDAKEKEQRKKLGFEDQIRLAIVRGMRVETSEKEIIKRMILQKDSTQVWNKIGKIKGLGSFAALGKNGANAKLVKGVDASQRKLLHDSVEMTPLDATRAHSSTLSASITNSHDALLDCVNPDYSKSHKVSIPLPSDYVRYDDNGQPLDIDYIPAANGKSKKKDVPWNIDDLLVDPDLLGEEIRP